MPILVVDSHLNIIEANFCSEKLFSTLRKALIGENLSKVLPDTIGITSPLSLDGLQLSTKFNNKSLQLLANAFGSQTIISIIPTTSETPHPSHADLDHPESQPSTEPIGFQLEQQRNSQKPSFAEEDFQTVAQLITHCVIWVDLVGVVQYLNPAAEKLLGYTLKESRGMLNILSLHDSEELREFVDQTGSDSHRSISNGLDALLGIPKMGVKFDREWTYLRKDHSRVPVLSSISPTKDRSGRINGYIVLAVDISQRKRTEKSMSLALESATESSRTKSSFLANMSHEIRTPMNSIIGMTELLFETSLSPEQRQYVEIFRRAGNTLLYLINDILDFSKIEAGRMTVEYVATEIRDLVSEITETFKMKADEKGIELIASVSPQTPKTIYTDPVRLKQVLANLISNAIKFTSKGYVKVEVSVNNSTARKGNLSFVITDTGIGISNDNIHKLFSTYTQSDRSISRRFGGTGLGLAISKNLVELLGGEIWITSTIGHGSVFTFTLQTPTESEATSQEGIVRKTLGGKLIYVIDSSIGQSFFITDTLRRYGAIVHWANSFSDVVYDELAQPSLVIINCTGLLNSDIFEHLKKIHLEQTWVLFLHRPGTEIAKEIESHPRPGILNMHLPVMKTQLLGKILEGFFRTSQVTTMAKTTLKQVTPMHSGGLKILIVDDSPDNRLIVRAYLRKSNHELFETDSGRLAIEKFKESNFDLILMDIQMPEMDGAQATKILRTIEADRKMLRTPIIALTAYSSKEDLDKCLEAGCDDVISKPIIRDIFLAKINAIYELLVQKSA
jgi:PAS domain S-box-containing protein